jgi:succinate dehydrogenase / fumarate reductase cytochrome b subunit
MRRPALTGRVLGSTEDTAQAIATISALEGRPVYRGHPGMLAWILHRITGVAVLVFLLGHIVETSMIMVSPEAYNRAIELYRQPWFKPLEFLLVAAVLYHAGNGIMVMILDFIPTPSKTYRRMFWIGAGLYVVALLPVAYLMLGKLVGLR